LSTWLLAALGRDQGLTGVGQGGNCSRWQSFKLMEAHKERRRASTIHSLLALPHGKQRSLDGC
jgi:hypothetical protein